MESWRLVWRDGFVPHLSTKALEKLRDALIRDDPRLTQGSTTTPPPLMCVQDWPVEAACALGFCGWQGDELTKVGEVEEFFARLCFQADTKLGEPAACRWFLNWFDDTPREQMRTEMIAEVCYNLNDRLTKEYKHLKKKATSETGEEEIPPMLSLLGGTEPENYPDW